MDGSLIALTCDLRDQQRMDCTQRLHLEKKYRNASAAFDAARARVQLRIGLCAVSEFEVLRGELELASAEVETALVALDAHVQEHRCMVHASTITPD
jgi:hypothetical protein